MGVCRAGHSMTHLLHQLILKCRYLDGSGWTSAFVQADIASTGTADSFIKVSHVTRTRHAHQATAATLYALLKATYDEYTSSEIQLEQWCLEQA